MITLFYKPCSLYRTVAGWTHSSLQGVHTLLYKPCSLYRSVAWWTHTSLQAVLAVHNCGMVSTHFFTSHARCTELWHGVHTLLYKPCSLYRTVAWWAHSSLQAVLAVQNCGMVNTLFFTSRARRTELWQGEHISLQAMLAVQNCGRVNTFLYKPRPWTTGWPKKHATHINANNFYICSSISFIFGTH